MEIDWNKAFVLLSVVEKCAGHPYLAKMQSAALGELQGMIAEPTPEEAPASPDWQAQPSGVQ